MMLHPGLPTVWGWVVIICMSVLTMWALSMPLQRARSSRFINITHIPVFAPLMRWALRSPALLLAIKLLMVALFLLVIFAGLAGSPIPERNLAVVLTWNIWWAGLIIAVFFFGTAWCAVCPWDVLATWLVRRRLWHRAIPNNSLNLRVPKSLRNVWPALLMLIGLTWLELGAGVTTSPYATAALALAMLVMATVSLAVFERKAFCRYFCPVGRTLGFYAQLAPVELRPLDPNVCANCKTLDCYHGNQTVEPCPTHLLMRSLNQNTYCTSCGNCSQSCPHQNIAWRLRSPGVEAAQHARPHWDEAWFMLGLLALTGFHGITMLPMWENWMSHLARAIGDSGQLLPSFTFGMLSGLAIPLLLYTLAVAATHYLSGGKMPFKRVFSAFAFIAVPLAFAYHLAHNLNHFVRESVGFGALCVNPLGIGTVPLSATERLSRQSDTLLSQDALFAMQAGLLVLGFWLSLLILRHRGATLVTGDEQNSELSQMPILLFAMGITSLHLWFLVQPMAMRM